MRRSSPNVAVHSSNGGYEVMNRQRAGPLNGYWTFSYPPDTATRKARDRPGCLEAAFEEKITVLEREMPTMAKKLQEHGQNHRAFNEMFELAMRFFSNPWNIWENQALEHKRTVLKPTFAEPLTYNRFEGIRTPKTSMIFNVLEGIRGVKEKMAVGVSVGSLFLAVRGCF